MKNKLYIKSLAFWSSHYSPSEIKDSVTPGLALNGSLCKHSQKSTNQPESEVTFAGLTFMGAKQST